MKLRTWLNNHYFDSAEPYDIVDERYNELNISWNDMMNYDFVAYIPGDLKSDAKIVVREVMN